MCPKHSSRGIPFQVMTSPCCAFECPFAAHSVSQLLAKSVEECAEGTAGTAWANCLCSAANVSQAALGSKLYLTYPCIGTYRSQDGNATTQSKDTPAGPGLAVRVLGDVTEGDALDVLRQVDEIYINTIRDFGLYDKIWQAFAVFLPVR